jgi:hypothetical protein
MPRTLYRLLYLLSGMCACLIAQETVSSDSSQQINTVDIQALQDTTVILKESPEKKTEPLYRPASTVPPKPTGSAAMGANRSGSAEASGRIVNSTEYIRGKMDGERDAKGKKIWFAAGLPGLCCYGIGVGGIVISFLVPPSPPEVVLIGKSGEYIMGYTEGFEKKGKLQNAKFASLGCLAGTAIELAFYGIFYLLMESSY